MANNESGKPTVQMTKGEELPWSDHRSGDDTVDGLVVHPLDLTGKDSEVNGRVISKWRLEDRKDTADA